MADRPSVLAFDDAAPTRADKLAFEDATPDEAVKPSLPGINPDTGERIQPPPNEPTGFGPASSIGETLAAGFQPIHPTEWVDPSSRFGRAIHVANALQKAVKLGAEANLQRQPPGPAKTAEEVLKGLSDTAGEFEEGFKSPFGVALTIAGGGGLPAWFHKLVGAGFSAAAIKNAYDRSPRLKKVIEDRDVEGIAREASGLAADLLQAGIGAVPFLAKAAPEKISLPKVEPTLQMHALAGRAREIGGEPVAQQREITKTGPLPAQPGEPIVQPPEGNAQERTTQRGGQDQKEKVAAQNVVLKEPTPEHLTNEKLIGGKLPRPAVSASYFQTLERPTDPETWVQVIGRIQKPDLYPQETAYQIGLYLRQLGEAKAAPVITAIQRAQKILVDRAKVQTDAGNFTHPDVYGAFGQQFLREAIESAHESLSGKGHIPEASAKPLTEKATPTGLRPAIRVNGKLFTGNDHVDAYEVAKRNGQPDTSGAEEGFITDRNKFLTREQAAQESGLPTNKEPGKLHSSDLPEEESQQSIRASKAGFTPAIELPDGTIMKAKPGETHAGMVRRAGLERARGGYVDESGKFHSNWFEVAKLIREKEESGVAPKTEPQAQPQTYRQKADALAAKLEGLKFSGELSDITGIGTTIWNGGIHAAQLILKAGGSVADAISAAVAHIKANHKGEFDEDAVRAILSSELEEKPARPQQAQQELPYSPLAHVEGELGTIKPKSEHGGPQKYYNESYKELQKKRPGLFKAGGSAIDQVVESLNQAGFRGITADNLFDQLLRWHNEEQAITSGATPEARADAFQKVLQTNAGKTSKSRQNFNINELPVGSSFKVDGNLFEIIDVNPDTGETTVDGGKKFGIQKIPEGAEIPADAGSIFEKGHGMNVYGIAERVREQRAAAGQVAPVEPGEGTNAPDSVEHGRDLLAAGADPEAALAEFEKTRQFNQDTIALTRAHGERLAKAAKDAEFLHGTSSPEFKAAFDALSDWDKRTKAIQTEWHKAGMAQQGETDIDTGTFTGLQRAFKEATGKDFNEKQAAQGKKHAKNVANADTNAANANDALSNDIDQQAGGTRAERRRLARATAASREAAADLKKAEADALKAAMEVRRAVAVQGATAENKARVRLAESERDRAETARVAAEKAQRAAQNAVRQAAIDLAKAKTKARARRAELANDPAQAELKRAQAAQAAVDRQHTEAAARLAEAENKARTAKAALEKKQAEQERAATQKELNKALAAKRKAARDLAAAEVKNRVNPELRVWEKARDYIEKGIDTFDEIRSKIATDLGMKVDQVTKLLAYTKRTKRLANDAWIAQQKARLVKQQAKRWLTDQQVPGYIRALNNVPRILFSLKVGFHGTVALGTHAPMVAFQPRFWGTYVRDFGKMYRMVGSPAYYESQVQALVRRPNYVRAKRAGLVNDPATYEDFNSPDTAKYFGSLTGMGNRGYSVLKILRQDMFDQHWNNLPKTSQIPEVAEAIADAVNHATGVIKARAPKGANIVLFAPRLEASRVAWLAVDPIKAVNTFLDWGNAGPGEKAFAINQLKEKAWVAGTLFGLLALNQGMLSATGSKQKINFDDPMKSDWLKFKAAGMQLSYGNAMLTMARMPARLWRIRSGPGGKLRNLIYPDEDTYSVLGEYGRSQLSPFASLATDLWLKGDWQNRPLPTSQRPVPVRLRRQGVRPYTWPEFWSEEVLPIPAEEALRDVWQGGMGMTPGQTNQMRKAFATLAVMSATGARLTDDVQRPKSQ